MKIEQKRASSAREEWFPCVVSPVDQAGGLKSRSATETASAVRTLKTVKPITTIYRGYRFRSRLEARWAVFLDALGVKWEYEAEGYDLGEAGWYLPDFWLPKLKMFLEVKRVGGMTPQARRKAVALARLTGSEVWECVGLPEPRWYQTHGKLWGERSSWEQTLDSLNGRGMLGLALTTYRRDAKNKCRAVLEAADERDRGHIKKLYAACNAARAARFEHHGR